MIEQTFWVDSPLGRLQLDVRVADLEDAAAGHPAVCVVVQRDRPIGTLALDLRTADDTEWTAAEQVAEYGGSVAFDLDGAVLRSSLYRATAWGPRVEEGAAERIHRAMWAAVVGRADEVAPFVASASRGVLARGVEHLELEELRLIDELHRVRVRLAEARRLSAEAAEPSDNAHQAT